MSVQMTGRDVGKSWHVRFSECTAVQRHEGLLYPICVLTVCYEKVNSEGVSKALSKKYSSVNEQGQISF